MSLPRAVVQRLASRRRRTSLRLLPDHEVLATNLSFVLHERSDSAAVAATLRECERHARALTRPAWRANPPLVSEPIPPDPDLWLTATLGAPDALAAALQRLTGRALVVLRVDAAPTDGAALRDASFFRAPASLALPTDACRIGVAALVVRPGGRATQLAARGPFAWPAEQSAALREIERLIQAYADQWLPPRALWAAPAEVLLRDEIV